LIVVDASAVVDYLMEAGPEGSWVRLAIRSEPEVAAPHLIDLEVVSSLRKLLARREIARTRAETALVDFRDLELVRYPATPLLERVWALRDHLTAYDASYVALSEALAVPLVTTDARLARSHGHRAEILAYLA
jgi:predicted nucleic acid-binding protein